MKKAAFTICAKNYIGLAQTLEASIRQHDSDIDFYIFVADEFDKDPSPALPPNVLISKDVLDIDANDWYNMAFKYDLTEFCTSIKPSCFKYIFEQRGAESCLFFDPDILVFNSLTPMYEQLEKYSVMVTPHITTIQETYTGPLNEQNLLYSGMYNLGFLGLKYNEDTQKIINWWRVRLKDRCFQNKMENYFTDQKWIDFIPSFFPGKTLISDNLGLNLAPWNFYEREVYLTDNSFRVKNRITNNAQSYPLTFIHFSGFNYQLLAGGEIQQQNLANFNTPEDLKAPFARYVKMLNDSNYAQFIKLTYTYNFFSNGTAISSVYRKLYRRLHDDGNITSNPFDASAELYKSLKDGGLLKEGMVKADKVAIKNADNVERKTLLINKVLNIIYKIVGAERFFLITRLMRLYSKTENHVYLVNKQYLKRFDIWN